MHMIQWKSWKESDRPNQGLQRKLQNHRQGIRNARNEKISRYKVEEGNGDNGVVSLCK